MKRGVNQWLFPDGMPAEDAVCMAKKYRFEAFEFCVGEDGPVRLDVSEQEARVLRAAAEREGLTVHSVGCGLGWQHPLCAGDSARWAEALEVTEQALRVAGWLGASALLVVPGVVDADTPYDQAYDRALEGVKALIPAAERNKVAIAIENVWNKFLLSPLEMRAFIDACDSEYVGAYVDVGNLIAYGYPEQWIRILGSRIRAIHMKDFRASVGTLGGFVMLMEGDVNWPAVMQVLRETGYDGALTAEYWTYTHSYEAVLAHMAAGFDHILK